MSPAPRILVIDNFDSFTYNLVHLLKQLDVPLEVLRNDVVTIEEAGMYTHILISPGPGVPLEAGCVLDIVRTYKGTRSIFGVCLGLQCLLEAEGVPMVNMPQVQHGAQEVIEPDLNSSLFQGLPASMSIGRYHSWACRPEQLPSDYVLTATSSDGYVMAVEHKTLPHYGVQFHPESIMTEHGLALMKNWLG